MRTGRNNGVSAQHGSHSRERETASAQKRRKTERGSVRGEQQIAARGQGAQLRSTTDASPRKPAAGSAVKSHPRLNSPQGEQHEEQAETCPICEGPRSTYVKLFVVA